MIKPTKLSVAIACSISALSQVHAAECERNVHSSCNVTIRQVVGDPKPSGPLYIFNQPGVPDKNTETVVNVNNDRTAHYRGEVFRIESNHPNVLHIPQCSDLKSDYDVIGIIENARIKNLVTSGRLLSEHKHAIYVGPKVQYDKIAIREGTVTSHAENHSTISIDGTASGSLTIRGAVHSEHNSALTYTTDPKYLWTKDEAGLPAPGEHSLLITAPVTSNSTNFTDGALSFGNIDNAYVAKALPQYNFKNIVIRGSLTGKNAGIIQRHGAVNVSDRFRIRSPIHGVNHAIRLGRHVNGEDVATFKANEVINQSHLSSYGSVVYAEGDVDIGTFTNRADVTVLPGTPVDGQALTAKNKAAFDFSNSLKRLNLVHERGKITGDILGSGKGDSFAYEGGEFHGSIRNVQYISVYGDQLSLESDDALMVLDLTKRAKVVTLHNGVTSMGGAASRFTSLNVYKEARLQLTEPAKLEGFNLSGTVEMDLDKYDDSLSGYLRTTGDTVLDCNTSKAIVTATTPELDKSYVLIDSKKDIQGDLASIDAMFDNEPTFYQLVKEKSDKTIGVSFRSRDPEVIRRKLSRAGLSDDEIDTVTEKANKGTEKTQRAIKSVTSEAQLQQVAKEISPTPQYTLVEATTTASKVSTGIDNRINVRSRGLETGISTGDGSSERGIWAQAYGSRSKQDGSKTVSGYDADNYGLTVGYDMFLEDEHLIGVAFSAGKTKATYYDKNKNDAQSMVLAFYGEYNTPSYGFEPQLLLGRIENDEKRYLNGKEGTSKYDTFLAGLRLLMHGQGTIQPLAGFNALYAKSEDHKFSSPVDDKIEESDRTAVELGIGVRYYQPKTSGFVPKAQIMGWWDVNNEGIDTRYTNGGAVLTVKGDKPEPFSIHGSLGADFLAGPTTFSCNLDGTYRSDFNDIGIGCQVRHEF